MRAKSKNCGQNNNNNPNNRNNNHNDHNNHNNHKNYGECCWDMAKLVVGFILTGVIGTIVSQYYKEQEIKNQLQRDARNMAISVFYDVIDTCNKRHYYALRAAESFSSLDYTPEEVKLRWKHYDDMVIYWNENRHRNIAMLKRYFGADSEAEFYKLIKSFYEIHKGLKELKKTPIKNNVNSEKSKQVFEIIYFMDDKISQFSEMLQFKLQTGSVDVYEPQPPINKP